ncbi:MAG: hypothetical protein GY928_17280 [Colwellia sp.]|nr:hypothetical protein [Colwellia sp.]
METDNKAERLALMTEIFYLSVMVNQETDKCVFLDYAGHVESITIQIAESKTNYLKEIASTEFYANYYEDPEKPLRFIPLGELSAKRDHMKALLKSNGVDFEGMSPVQEIITTYEF